LWKIQLDEVESIEPIAAEVAEELGGGGGAEDDGDEGDRFVGLFLFFSTLDTCGPSFFSGHRPALFSL